MNYKKFSSWYTTLERKEYQKIFSSYLKIISLIFLVSLIIGGGTAFVFPTLATLALEQIATGFAKVQELSGLGLFWYIFLHNLEIAVLLFFLGFFFGLIPIFLVFTNGYIIGLISFLFVVKRGFLITLVGLLPHGIFELPAIIIAASLGLLLGGGFAKKLFTKKEVSVKDRFLFGLHHFTLFVVPLLFLAALIESFLTASILQIFMTL